MTFSKIKYPSIVSFQFIVFNYNQYIWRTTTDFHPHPSTVPASSDPSLLSAPHHRTRTLRQAELLGGSTSGGKEVAITSSTRAYSRANKWLFPFPGTLPLTLQRLCCLCLVILQKKIHLFYNHSSNMQIVFCVNQILSVIYTRNETGFLTTTFNWLPWRNPSF